MQVMNSFQVEDKVAAGSDVRELELPLVFLDLFEALLDQELILSF